MLNPSWVFIGGRRHGQRLLERLFAEGHLPSFTYILEEDAHEHEKHSLEIAELCARRDVPFKITKKVGLADVENIRALDPNVIAVMGWRTIIPTEILSLPRFGCVALHDSLLPRYRGFAPINWAIINGEEETGVSLFYLDQGVDSGPVIAQRRIAIRPDATAADVYGQVTDAAVDLLAEYVPKVARGKVPAQAQDSTLATFTCSRTPDDGRIDWSSSTRQIYNLVRALGYPYPGAFTHLEGRRLIVWDLEIVEPAPVYVGRVPGRVVSVGGTGVDVLTADGVVRLGSVQVEGQDRKRAGEVIRSVRLTLGATTTPALTADADLIETVYQMSLPPGGRRT